MMGMGGGDDDNSPLPPPTTAELISTGMFCPLLWAVALGRVSMTRTFLALGGGGLDFAWAKALIRSRAGTAAAGGIDVPDEPETSDYTGLSMAGGKAAAWSRDLQSRMVRAPISCGWLLHHVASCAGALGTSPLFCGVHVFPVRIVLG
jgi:hypothetical protein